MNKQRGYFVPDLTGFFVFMVLSGVAAGIFSCWFLPLVWNWIKPWLHAITA